jgi:hypothetical protein
MVSKPFAFGLLLGACVVAAGGGAYIATLQHVRSTVAAPAPTNAPSPAAQPQQVASDPPASPITDVAAAPETSARSDAAAARPGSSAPPSDPAVARKPSSNSAASRQASPETPVTPSRPAEIPSANLGTAAPVPTLPGGDPGPAGQRPWPGPPASSAPAAPPVVVSGEQTGEPPAHDNVKLWEELVVPIESVLGLQLESSLNTELAQIEDRVDARLTRDVRVNGRVAIPSGSHVVGSVVQVERGGRMKERARIGIRFNSLTLADGTRMQIQTDTVYRESESPANKASAKIGGAAIGGAIIGAIIGGGKGAAIGSGVGAGAGTAAAMSSDRMRVVLPAGTTVSVRTQAPITVTVEK